MGKWLRTKNCSLGVIKLSSREKSDSWFSGSIDRVISSDPSGECGSRAASGFTFVYSQPDAHRTLQRPRTMGDKRWTAFGRWIIQWHCSKVPADLCERLF